MVVANVATPVAESVPVPSEVAPSKNCTLPVGFVVSEPVTVAVNVTDPPNATDAALVVSTAVGKTFEIVSVYGELVWFLYFFLLPVNVATTEWLPMPLGV